mmetsp:Transcript_42593/g.40856  ORF Transcript_42593/g.40856 Transcript_42593/m.40856 type:complete len:494 (+) Transcript_42593:377-1858(+)
MVLRSVLRHLLRHHVQVALAHHHRERLRLRRHPHRRLRGRRHRTDRIRINSVGDFLAGVDCLVFGFLAAAFHGRVDAGAARERGPILQRLPIVRFLGPHIIFEVLEVFPFEELGPFLFDFLVCDAGDGFLDLFSESEAVFLGGELEGVLDDKVAIGVHDEIGESVAVDEFAHDDLELVGGGVLDAPVDDVGGALLHAELEDLPVVAGDQLVDDLLVPVLEHLLDRVVPVRILRQFDRIHHQLAHELLPVVPIGRLLDDDLDHTQPAVVGGQLDELVEDLLEHKLPLLLLEAFYDVLDHVGTLRVKGKFRHMSSQHPLEILLLRLQIHQIYELLDGVCALFVAADLDEAALDLGQNEHPLVTGAIDDEPLTEVVSIVVGHEVGEVVLDFGEQKLDDLGVGAVQQPLQELAPSLVDGQLVDAPLQSLQLLLLATGLFVFAHDVYENLFVSVHEDPGGAGGGVGRERLEHLLGKAQLGAAGLHLGNLIDRPIVLHP